MCIESPKRKGIGKLPKVGIYYKQMCRGIKGTIYSVYRTFVYKRGWNDIPEARQDTHRKDGSCGRYIRAGGHFLVNKPKGRKYRKVYAFEIHREDITYVGETYKYGKTVLAKRAKLLGLARNIKRLRKVKGKKK